MKILFAYPDLASFVKRDLRILREQHDVDVRCIYHRNPFRFLGDVRAMAKSDLLFLWFAGVYALPLVLVARLLGKKVITVVGGYEAANSPEIKYGSARKPLLRAAVRLILHQSDRILAVSMASQKEIETNLSFAAENIPLVYHGFEDAAFNHDGAKERTVITVSRMSSETWLVKGIYDFISAADEMPDLDFVHIGAIRIDVAAKYGRPLPLNLKLIGEVPFARLGHYLGTAKVYLQLSRHESFGCSVAEAMLYRCIPVVTNSGALPEVVGDCGITIGSSDPRTVAEAIARALALGSEEGERARQRILTHFSFEQRRDALLQIIDEIARR
jgi:glycosyltransferase involved in cell wall biosynthesis